MGENGEGRMNGLGEGGDKFGDHFFVSPFRWTSGWLSGLKKRNPKYANKKSNFYDHDVFYNMFAT